MPVFQCAYKDKAYPICLHMFTYPYPCTTHGCVIMRMHVIHFSLRCVCGMYLYPMVYSGARAVLRCSLQALCTLDLSGCRPADWHVYHHYERYGGTASLRLTAADCVLRLSLLLNVMGLGQGRGRCDPARDTVNVWADCGWCCHGINEKMNVRTRPVLAIAVQFGERRSHNPLEQLRLWASMHCLLSSRLVRGTPLAIQRKRLASRGGAESSAAAQLLWRMMRSGAAGHPGLRCVLCEVKTAFRSALPKCTYSAPRA
jgi:hypothetical protein